MREQVQVSEVSLIPPSRKTSPHKRLTLSLFDHWVWFAPYRSRILFYDNQGSMSTESIVARLKESLAEALCVFYPFAGRLLVGVDGKMEVDCNGAGAQFMEAFADTQLGDLDELQLPRREVCEELAQTTGHTLQRPWKPDTPLLFIQVTHFRCGGMSLSFRYCHQVCDGTSSWHFMNSWAKLARGERVSVHPVITYEPIQKLLNAPMKSVEEFESPPPFGYVLLKRGSFSLEGAESNKDLVLSTRWLRFPKQFLQDLKRKAGAAQGQEFSTFQVLSAYIWHKITIARGLRDETSFQFVMNCRERVASIPSAYFGNAMVLHSAKVTAEALKDDFSIGALALKESIGSVTEASIRAAHSMLESYLGGTQNLILPSLAPAENVTAGSSHKFPLYETDFGWGSPIAMTIPPVARDGALYYFPGRQDGSIDVSVSLRVGVMEKLLKDVVPLLAKSLPLSPFPS